jgi:FMN phosphatase YigB (HAD superfamily)
MSAMISVALFDLGGVVCRFEPAARLSRLAALSGMPEREVHERIWESGLPEDFDRGRYTSPEWHSIVTERLGVELEFEVFEDVMLSALSTDEEVLAVVDAIDPRIRVAMLTDNPPLLLDAIPQRFPGLVSRFDPMLFSFQLGALKPSREAFVGALARLNVDPAQVFFIDDTRVNVEAAAALGMSAVQFTSATALREHFSRCGMLRVA